MVARPFFMFQGVAYLTRLSFGILRCHDVARAGACSLLYVSSVLLEVLVRLSDVVEAYSRVLLRTYVGHNARIYTQS